MIHSKYYENPVIGKLYYYKVSKKHRRVNGWIENTQVHASSWVRLYVCVLQFQQSFMSRLIVIYKLNNEFIFAACFRFIDLAKSA